MDKTEKPKITQALLEECMKAHEKLSKSKKLLSATNRPVRSTPQGLFQMQQENSED